MSHSVTLQEKRNIGRRRIILKKRSGDGIHASTKDMRIPSIYMGKKTIRERDRSCLKCLSKCKVFYRIIMCISQLVDTDNVYLGITQTEVADVLQTYRATAFSRSSHANITSQPTETGNLLSATKSGQNNPSSYERMKQLTSHKFKI